MPRLDIKDKRFRIDNDEIRNYFNSDDISYTNMYTKKDRLENKDGISDMEKKVLDWINRKLKLEINKDDGPKRARMHINAPGTKNSSDGTKSNNFKNRRPDDNANNNVGKIGKLVGIKESELDKEINSIKYLIEYMDNNKKNKI